ncbi:MAG TPA: N-methyl-D-aspartate receptor NMDAR2C subunit [Albitalea sp.]
MTPNDRVAREPSADRLSASWQRMWSGLGARGDGQEVFAEVVARYEEPHRKYHDLQHLRECLDAFAAVAPLAERPAEVEAALWFHDAVYEIGRGDNEERSARWAQAGLAAAGAPAEAAGRVAALVRATRHATVPASNDERLVVDIDLAILGAAEERFAEYERQIRAEYATVPDAVFRHRRRAILQAFLDRPHVYGTAHFRERLEARARANLARAIAATMRASPT